MDWSQLAASGAIALSDPRLRRRVERLEAIVQAVVRALEWLSGGRDAGLMRRAPLIGCVLSLGLLIAHSTASAGPPAPPPLPIVPGGDFLSFLMVEQDTTFVRWMSAGKDYAAGLFGFFLLIQLVLVPGREGIKGDVFSAMNSLIDTALRKGLWGYFIATSDQSALALSKGVAYVGEAIAFSNIQAKPATYLALGDVAFINIADATWEGGLLEIGPSTLVALCAGGATLGLFTLSAWVMAFTILYVKLVAVGGLLLTGFAGFDGTSRYAWRYLEFLVRGGFKHLGLSLVLGLAATTTEQWSLMANNVGTNGVQVHTLAMNMFAGSMGFLFLLILAPQLSSSMVSGNLGDTGEGTLASGLGMISQGAAAVAGGFVASRLMSGASAGAVASAGVGETAEQRAQALIQAASGNAAGAAHGGGNPRAGGGPAAPAGGAGEPRKPGESSASSGSGSKASGKSSFGFGRAAGAMARGVRAAQALNEVDDEN